MSIVSAVQLRIGDVDISQYLVDYSLSTPVNGITEAVVKLKNNVSEITVDLSAPIAIAIDQSRLSTTAGRTDGVDVAIQFTGMVDHAAVDWPLVILHCSAGFGQMHGVKLGAFTVKSISSLEVVHLVASTAGLADDEIYIEGYDRLQESGHEPFEVVAPITGLQVDKKIQVGRIWLLPIDVCPPLIAEMMEDAGGLNGDISGYAVAISPGRTLLEAERVGLADIDAALSWLAVRARDSRLAIDGVLREFTMRQLGYSFRRTDQVAVRGIISGRRYLRNVNSAWKEYNLTFEGRGLPSDPILPAIDLDEGNRFALLAWKRAADSRDPISTVLALSEFLEFYCAKIKVPLGFDNTQVRLIRRALKAATKVVDKRLRKRVFEVMGKLTDPSLPMKLQAALDQDKVPYSDYELSVLKDLRELRNDAVHGRAYGAVPVEKLRVGISLTARMLVQRFGRNY